MGFGSWLRFITGILMSLEVIRSYFTDSPSVVAIILAFVFLALAAMWILTRH